MGTRSRFRRSTRQLERHPRHEDLVGSHDTGPHPFELPDTFEPGARVPQLPRRVTRPWGGGQVDRQLTRIFLTLLIGVVVFVVVAVARG